MDLQLPNIGKTMTNNILPSILSTDTLSIWISLGKFREIPSMYRLKSVVSVNFRIWSKYVG